MFAVRGIACLVLLFGAGDAARVDLKKALSAMQEFASEEAMTTKESVDAKPETVITPEIQHVTKVENQTMAENQSKAVYKVRASENNDEASDTCSADPTSCLLRKLAKKSKGE
mmetsp:Transcript_128338/g.247351  ORF Transcript_128338/g.247351 Transcript_128338/m.247351 type:complete len:113 (+) Transcript_128338:94-432(+)